jgi:hypothetical protein
MKPSRKIRERAWVRRYPNGSYDRWSDGLTLYIWGTANRAAGSPGCEAVEVEIRSVPTRRAKARKRARSRQ